jgi:pSer/pThr/pTyr-binding forkhead associated (FHA) protein
MAVKPAQPQKDHILTVEDDKGRREILMKKNKYSMGRSQQCDIRIYSLFVSRHHATLIRQFDENGYAYYELVDGDGSGKLSSNGILVNGDKVHRKTLKHGDKMVFGPQVFAIYQHSQKDIFPSIPSDDFDITLIDPAMIVADLED